MFCLGDGRTVLHDTKVGELWGHNVEKWPHLIFRRAHQNAKHLIQNNLDPLRLICDRAHARGALVTQSLPQRDTGLGCSRGAVNAVRMFVAPISALTIRIWR